VKPPLLADPAIETAPQLDEGTQSLKRGRTGAVLGVASAALLFASFRWAHHWGLLSGAVVAAWASSTIAALVVSGWSLRTTGASRRLATLGVALTVPSLLAVVLLPVLYALGADVSAACGGG